VCVGATPTSLGSVEGTWLVVQAGEEVATDTKGPAPGSDPEPDGTPVGAEKHALDAVRNWTRWDVPPWYATAPEVPAPDDEVVGVLSWVNGLGPICVTAGIVGGVGGTTTRTGTSPCGAFGSSAAAPERRNRDSNASTASRKRERHRRRGACPSVPRSRRSTHHRLGCSIPRCAERILDTVEHAGRAINRRDTTPVQSLKTHLLLSKYNAKPPRQPTRKSLWCNILFPTNTPGRARNAR
jgi:hypothetical protein